MTNLARAAAVVSILAFLLGLGAAAHIVEQTAGDEAKATLATGTWLEGVDAARYAQSWDRAAALLRSAVTRAQWEQQLGGLRAALGAPGARKLISTVKTTSLPGAPQGTYVVLQFEVAFAQRPALETVTSMLEADGQWRVAGYYVR